MLDVKDLRVQFLSSPHKWAVDGVSFHMDDGELIGIVGESGCGKTVTAMALSGLLKKKDVRYEGTVKLDGREMLDTDRDNIRNLQGTDLAVVFQEPLSALDPIMKVGPQVEEAIMVHYPEIGPEERKKMAFEAMENAGLYDLENVYQSYPHQLSGGMLQRICIAAALISKPKLLIADEPTTALDVTTQAHILEILKRINKEQGTGIIMISHNLAVVNALCTRIIVMKGGKIVEDGPAFKIRNHPENEYTKQLIAAIPTREKRYR
ncbi:MAG: ABC transporter ATP-binding protein [Firmicutes bacterium]|nr:ABC transporter ATP-binding protein [Bacillota bacterium]